VGTRNVPVIVPELGDVIAQLPEKLLGAGTAMLTVIPQPVSNGLKPEPLTVTGYPGAAAVGETEMVGVVTVKVWIAVCREPVSAIVTV
jgi:hypothetical protein